MPKRIPLSAIGLTRTVNGKDTTVYPEIGKVFDFTDDELKELKAVEKASKRTLLRQATNEDPDGEGSVTLDDGSSTKVDLGKLNKAQLTQYASEKQIDISEAKTRDQIQATIEAAEEAAVEGGEGGEAEDL